MAFLENTERRFIQFSNVYASEQISMTTVATLSVFRKMPQLASSSTVSEQLPSS